MFAPRFYGHSSYPARHFWQYVCFLFSSLYTAGMKKQNSSPRPGRPINPNSLRQRYGPGSTEHPRVVFHCPAVTLELVRELADSEHSGLMSPAIRELLVLGLAVKTRKK